MCGIFALLNNKYSDNKRVQESFKKGKDRGPENSKFLDLQSIHCSLGFHRLAINGVDDENSNQPFFIEDVYLVCNGEIYNHKEISQNLIMQDQEKKLSNLKQ